MVGWILIIKTLKMKWIIQQRNFHMLHSNGKNLYNLTLLWILNKLNHCRRIQEVLKCENISISSFLHDNIFGSAPAHIVARHHRCLTCRRLQSLPLSSSSLILFFCSSLLLFFCSFVLVFVFCFFPSLKKPLVSVSVFQASFSSCRVRWMKRKTDGG